MHSDLAMTKSPKSGRPESGAGAPKHRPAITPAMLDAGERVLCSFETFTADERYWAERVYEAMARVAALEASQRRERCSTSHACGGLQKATVDKVLG
jgi:hypothetical protein